jgi:hypothetical protein
MLASALITGVSLALQDSSNIRWTQAELLFYLNQGQKEIAAFKPNASVTNASVQLVQGTKQALPSGGLILIEVTRNMGVGGATPGDAIRLVSRGVLDAQVPGWHSATASATVKNYTYSPADPTRFYVYPPQPGSPTYVEIVYGKMPEDLDDYVDPINVDDVYAPALHNYMLFRAYSKDSEFAANSQLAAAHYTMFMQQLTGKVQGETAVAPTKGVA